MMSPFEPRQTADWAKRFFSDCCIKVKLVNKVLWPPLNLYGCGSTTFETPEVAEPPTRRLGG
jgi:hypothetical protein